MDNYNERIRKLFNKLTKRQKLVAKYIVDFPKEVAFQTAKEVGTASQTSDTTVIRLSYALGYSGYSELQKEIQSSLIEDSLHKTDPIEDFRSTSKSLKDINLIQHVIEQDSAYVRSTLEQLDYSQYKKAVDLLINSEMRIVIGFRSSYGPANWLTFSLNIVVGNTLLYRGEIEDANYFLSLIDERTLVVAISFPRYTKETNSFVKAAKKKGAKVLAITDDELSPLGLLSDILFKVVAPSPIPLKGITPTFALLNLLVTSIAASQETKVQKRLEEYDQTSDEFSPFTKM
ncbi:MurR/RpiR family transcriptional regulator [Bacillus firmus]|uniref:MurR/RpiR family transcriptional regulator n=1 Tax=Cytobacillus firmus TaxID=1399 RepID=UPI001580350F|nr:MurR/RpiR family transcriptional regulator [Cytobacillus firmus]MBG9549136.1 transcriptional regulator [Cytobacillus firmus]MBG9603101.1 transcriptional regulator [Cytobacillus firmus]MBG9654921.1 transcriptional regulator [Cytobacillus firmus]MDD9311821.1 MurR/RpiR family transcriptional regulator [Cytobacillus firmus]MED1907655.1 MurR/RpiR family transcriptional regulator [Cytobacillus firmus]